MAANGKHSSEDLRIIHAGLKLYVRNARAGAGTMKGLGKAKLADELEAEAGDVEERLMPSFDEQGHLELSSSK